MAISERPQSHQVKLLFCMTMFSDKRTELKDSELNGTSIP